MDDWGRLPEIYRGRAQNRIRELRKSMVGQKGRPEVEGIKFKSMREAERFLFLRELERAHMIWRMEVHPEIVVSEGITYRDGEKWVRLPVRILKGSFRYVARDHGKKMIVINEVVHPSKQQKVLIRFARIRDGEVIRIREVE